MVVSKIKLRPETFKKSQQSKQTYKKNSFDECFAWQNCVYLHCSIGSGNMSLIEYQTKDQGL